MTMTKAWARALALLLVLAMGAGLVACSSDDGDDGADGADSGSDDSAPAGDEAAAEDEVPQYQLTVEALADDELAGRDNGTPGSVAAQDLIIEQLEAIGAEPVPDADPADPYRQVFTQLGGGTNVLGALPGTGDGAPAEEVV